MPFSLKEVKFISRPGLNPLETPPCVWSGLSTEDPWKPVSITSPILIPSSNRLRLGSRATSIFRFGFIALDLISLVLKDSGEYVCRVTSATGSVESRALLSVNQRASIEQTSQHPDSLKYIQQLEDYSKYQRSDSLEESINQKPHFIRPLQDLGELQEGRNAHIRGAAHPSQ
jgi:hypothetical protein